VALHPVLNRQQVASVGCPRSTMTACGVSRRGGPAPALYMHPLPVPPLYPLAVNRYSTCLFLIGTSAVIHPFFLPSFQMILTYSQHIKRLFKIENGFLAGFYFWIYGFLPFDYQKLEIPDRRSGDFSNSLKATEST
jgi:hypothetical protein